MEGQRIFHSTTKSYNTFCLIPALALSEITERLRGGILQVAKHYTALNVFDIIQIPFFCL